MLVLVYMNLSSKGVLHAIDNIKNITAPVPISMNFDMMQQSDIDKVILDLDGTQNKSKLDTNVILAFSLAVQHSSVQV